MTDLDEFDSALESETTEVEVLPPSRMTPTAINALVFTNDVASKLARGESPKDVALELGITEQTLRKKMRTAPMQDLLAIESRRIVRHLSKRDLSKERYRDLATSAAIFLDKEDKLRNVGMGSEDRVIDKTIINQITVLVSGRGNEVRSKEESPAVPQLAESDLPEVPEIPASGTEEETPGDDLGS